MRKIRDVLAEVHAYAYGDSRPPYRGWHEDFAPGETNYLPMLQQSRHEFKLLLEAIDDAGLIGGRCLQLGLGMSGGAHEVWRIVFNRVITIDLALTKIDDAQAPGMNTHSRQAVAFALANGPYDFLFIDAGHSYDDVQRDFLSYAPMVRSGGIVAFHDALERAGYPEVKVHEFIKQLPIAATFGTEVGTAYMVMK